jgi:tripartite-type tricarboxylate transporter receptor subunit TctC
MMIGMLKACMAGVVLALATGVAQAQAWPGGKVIRLVVPYPPGGSTDIVGRYVGQKLAEVLGSPVIVENRPGAGTNIGTESVARAPADGTTLLIGSFANGVNRALFPNLRFDPTRDLLGISLISLGSIIMTVPPDFPAKTVGEFVAIARAQPGRLNYGVGGAGSSAHLAGELFKSLTGTQIEPVLYKGGAAALQDLIAGRVQLIFDNPQILLPLEKAGRVKLLAVTGKDRAAYHPGLPTMIEAGVPGYEIYSWYGLMGPTGLPADVVRTLEDAMAKIAAMPEVKARFTEWGIVPIGSNAQAMTEFFLNENRKWEKVVREAKITVD